LCRRGSMKVCGCGKSCGGSERVGTRWKSVALAREGVLMVGARFFASLRMTGFVTVVVKHGGW
jgi:hypothetical protein